MRRTIRLTGPAALAACVFVFAFGVYAVTQGPGLQGYEPETEAVVDGFLHTGDFKIVSPFRQTLGEGVPGKDGKLVGRAGLPQELLEIPFYAGGWLLDRVAHNPNPYHWRTAAVLLYNPAVAALSAAVLFVLVLELSGSAVSALLVTGLFAVASIAWPYAKIGMDTTLMLAMLLAFGAMARIDADSGWQRWALAGFGAGMAVATKPYSLPAVLAAIALLAPVWRASAKQIVAVALPFLLWVAAMLWFNWLREGSVLKTGNPAPFQLTGAAPVSFVGYFVSPGKGLVFYSPLVVLGMLGVPALMRAHPRFTRAMVASGALFTLAVACIPSWTDETWGPRYLVPVAWMLLVPIPWWATSCARRRVLGAVAAIAVAVQAVAIAVPYTQIFYTAPKLAGINVYSVGLGGPPVALGDDSLRWVPQLSPLLIQGAFVVSRAGQALGAPPITYTYHPYRGIERSLTFTPDAAAPVSFQRPDFWWAQHGGAGRLLAIPLLIGAAVAGAALLRRYRDTSPALA